MRHFSKNKKNPDGKKYTQTFHLLFEPFMRRSFNPRPSKHNIKFEKFFQQATANKNLVIYYVL
jgi:hypothetical protein